PEGGEPRVLTKGVDRNVRNPVWAADSQSIQVVEEDDRTQRLERVSLDGKMSEVAGGRRVISDFALASGGHEAVLMSDIAHPSEVYALDKGGLRPLSHANDAWLSELKLASIEEVSFHSKDGSRVDGFVVRPPDYQPGKRYPTLLINHGGPVS